MLSDSQVVPVHSRRQLELLQDPDDVPRRDEHRPGSRAAPLVGLLRPVLPAAQVPGRPPDPSPRARPEAARVGEPLRRGQEVLRVREGREHRPGGGEARVQLEQVALG